MHLQEHDDGTVTGSGNTNGRPNGQFTLSGRREGNTLEFKQLIGGTQSCEVVMTVSGDVISGTWTTVPSKARGTSKMVKQGTDDGSRTEREIRSETNSPGHPFILWLIQHCMTKASDDFCQSACRRLVNLLFSAPLIERPLVANALAQMPSVHLLEAVPDDAHKRLLIEATQRQEAAERKNSKATWILYLSMCAV